ncbi:MAG TPA: hypothetical protein VFD92_10040 [Candidatus Binatia bacterium]|nr:hypothetical protein [Candidatus Binatia bacterium]
MKTTLACDCRARGMSKHVQFGASTDFQCVTPPNPDLQIAFTGRASAKGKRLANVQGVSELGESFFAECVRDPACSIESLAGPGARSRYGRR